MRSERLKWPEYAKSSESIDHVNSQKRLEEIFPDADLCDLLRRLLQMDPDKRITAKEALRHRFFSSIK
jgi:serine/threonine protein kinase